MRRLRSAGVPSTIGAHVGAAVGAISRRHRELGSLGERWGELVPAALSERVRPESCRKGTLTVRALDAGAAYEFDRWLRSGGRGALGGAGVRSVRIAPGGACETFN